MLFKTGAEPEFICENNGGWSLMNDVDDGILGGQSVCFQPYGKANNEKMEDAYNPQEPKSWLTYLDVNSLYPDTMTKALPYDNYESVELVGNGIEQVIRLMQAYSDEDTTGYMIVCDFLVPDHKHDELDFAPLTRLKPDPAQLSEYQRDLNRQLGGSTSEKVVPFLGTHYESRRHIALLKFYILNFGCQLLKVHRILSLWQETLVERLHGPASRTASGKHS